MARRRERPLTIPQKGTQYFAVLSLTALTALALFAIRTLDDNRLTSWEWVFGAVKITELLAALVPAGIAAFILAKNTAPERYPAAFLFVLSFAAAALLWGEPEMNVDASRYFTQAKHLELYGVGYFAKEWGTTIAAWTDLPLMPFLYGLAFRYMGEARIYIQGITTLLFSLTVVLTYLIGKALWDKETGLWGGMFLLGIPFLLTQAPLMLVDTSTMFFLTLAVYTFLIALERGGRWVPAASAALFFAIFSKYSAWLMLSVLIVIGAVRLFEAHRSAGETPLTRYGFRTGIIILMAALAAGTVVFLNYKVFASQISLLLSYQKPGLRRWGESFISTFLFQVHPFITASAVFSVWIAWKRKDPKYLIISWLMVLIVVLRIKRIRYTLITFPMFSLMAAYGLAAIRDAGLKKCIAFSVVTYSIVIALCAYLPFLKQTSARNLQRAGAFITTLPGEDLEVVTLPRKNDEVNSAVSVPLLDLFTNKRIHYRYHLEYAPPPEKIAVSPLRFTWAYKNPGYYACGSGPGAAAPVAVIAGEPVRVLPEDVERKVKGLRHSTSFSLSDDIFDHQTLVTVYY